MMILRSRKIKKYYTKSFDEGSKEHLYEFLTTVVLVFGVINALALLKYVGWSYWERVLSGWLILALIIHLVARYHHRKEKKYRSKINYLNH